MPLQPEEIARHFFDGDQPQLKWFHKIRKKPSGWIAGDEEFRTGGKKGTRVEARVGQARLSYVLADDGSGVLQSYGHYPLAVRLRNGDIVLNDAEQIPSMTTMRQWYDAKDAAKAYAARTGRSMTYVPLEELVQRATDITPVSYTTRFPVGTKICPVCEGRRRKRGEDYCWQCDGRGFVPIHSHELHTLQTKLRKTRKHRVLVPHGGCAAAGHCIEPVPAEEKCSAGL